MKNSILVILMFVIVVTIVGTLFHLEDMERNWIKKDPSKGNGETTGNFNIVGGTKGAGYTHYYIQNSKYYSQDYSGLTGTPSPVIEISKRKYEQAYSGKDILRS